MHCMRSREWQTAQVFGGMSLGQPQSHRVRGRGFTPCRMRDPSIFVNGLAGAGPLRDCRVGVCWADCCGPAGLLSEPIWGNARLNPNPAGKPAVVCWPDPCRSLLDLAVPIVVGRRPQQGPAGHQRLPGTVPAGTSGGQQAVTR